MERTGKLSIASIAGAIWITLFCGMMAGHNLSFAAIERIATVAFVVLLAIASWSAFSRVSHHEECECLECEQGRLDKGERA